MANKIFFDEIRTEVASIFDANSQINITRTATVPNVEDAGFTLASGDGHKAKTIETCVLFIDIRNSTQLNFKYSAQVLAKLYSAFIVTMLRGAEYYNGYVRNINGDRIMVVFDSDNCFINALNTATLLQTICKYIIDTYFIGEQFECGIGIDYGEMLVVKTGTIKKGKENQFYKSFVWLGKPANLASKLTDMANKNNLVIKLVKKVFGINFRRLFDENQPQYTYNNIGLELSSSDFADSIVKDSELDPVTYNKEVVLFWSRVSAVAPQILITEEVYKGMLLKHSESAYIKNSLISKSTVKMKGYDGQIYGMNTYFPSVEKA